MGQILSNHDRNKLDLQIAEAERRTKTQIVLATVKRSDSYAEIPWKAFAFGASIAGLMVVAMDLLLPGWSSNTTVLLSVAAILAAGAVFALLTILSSGFARLFLSNNRAETEARQYAESLFLGRELFATNGRTGILLLVSLFEREVVILPDKGLGNRLSISAMNNIITKMAGPLKRKKLRLAMEIGLDMLISIMEPSASGGPANDEISNNIIEDKGI